MMARPDRRRAALSLVAATLVGFAATAHAAPAAAPAAAAKPASSAPEMTTAAYGDWVVACVGTGPSMRCEGLHGLKNAQGQSAAVLAVGNPAKGQPLRLSLRVPVSVLLASPASLTIGTEAPIAMPFSICIPQGCFADISLDSPAVAGRLRDATAGTAGVMRWQDAGNNKIELPVSFKGLAAVFDRLRELDK